jgi:large subunit ribosomal protein L9
MQLVLTEDVQHLGKQGDLVEVKPGYGRNYLLPNGLATTPTAHNLRLLERYKQRVQQAREAKIADLRVLAEQIQRETVTIEENAHETVDEEGKKRVLLYGSVGAHEISKAMKAKNLNVDAEMVRLEGPIRECALYAVKINLGHDIETDVKVLVVKQQDKKEGGR